MAETGVEEVASEVKAGPAPGEPLRLLFVGRIIRTKGILDGIRALALCPDTVNVRLDVVGAGDLLETCKAEVERLGITDKVAFHGRLSRDEVFEHYRRSHVFLFPSFREPSGNVVFEAMSQGLPVITSSIGGPGYVVDRTCGLRVNPADPDNYPEILSEAISEMAMNPQKISLLSEGALLRMKSMALWPSKIRIICKLYKEILESSNS
jgi:glycosyltransferase involved in cell wall biosynthesis